MGKRPTTLFRLLLTAFLVVMLLPVGGLLASYHLWGNQNLVRSLQGQVQIATERDAQQIASVLDSFRHDAYLLSTNPDTIRILEEDPQRLSGEESRKIYAQMFLTMRSESSSAIANIVSNSGNVRLSTHEFPSDYDLRFHTNGWDVDNVLSQMENRSQTASMISIRGRQASNAGEPIIATIIRRVYNTEGKNLGYVIVEVTGSAFSGKLNQNSMLIDEILIDRDAFYARSILHPTISGGFDRFPALDAKMALVPHAYVTNDSVVNISPLAGTELLVAGTISATPYQNNMQRWLLVVAIAIVIGSCIAILVAMAFTRSVDQPIKSLVASMKDVEQGNMKPTAGRTNIKEIKELDASFNRMVGQITNLLQLTREEESKVAEAERKALESQMNPHFLFNTLNTIKALARMHHEDQIYQITLKLGKLLRSTVDNHESECSIEESIDLIESYLTIQGIRFGEKLHTDISVQESTRDCMTPKLIIQPMVENAIVHGLEPKAGDWHISIKITESEGMLAIIVSDDGIGFDRSTLPSNLDDLEGSSHVGVYNAYRRIKMRFGDQSRFTIDSKVGEGTIITMRMPAVHQSEKEA